MAQARPAQSSVLPSVLHRFVERTRRAASHDLRAPLAAIVNYAAVLEEERGVEPDRLRPTTQRIRHHALQMSEMMRALIEAIALAARPADLVHAAHDPLDIVERTIVDAGFDELVTPVDAREDRERLELDAELLRYALRAFLALECSVRPGERRPLRVVAARRPAATVELAFADGAGQDEEVALDLFLHGYTEESPRSSRFELMLARELYACYGGDLAVGGRAGGDARLRLVAAASRAS